MTLVREAKMLARSALSWYLNWVPDQALSSLALTSLEHGVPRSPLGGSRDLGLVWLARLKLYSAHTCISSELASFLRRMLQPALDWVGAGSWSRHRSDPA